MRIRCTSLWLCLSALLGACQAPLGQEPSAAESPKTRLSSDLPPSALGALVRVLEAMDARSNPDVEVRIRALECDTLAAQQQLPSRVRVVLDLTLYAPQITQAQEAFDELLGALEEQGVTPARSAQVVPLRIQHVFGEMPWTAPRVHAAADFGGLVSLSESLRVDVFGTPPAAGPLPGSPMQLQSSRVTDYIDAVARSAEIQIDGLETELSPHRLPNHQTELRYRIRPARQDSSYLRQQIGAFLMKLESGSPGVKLTHVEIAPADPGDDLRRDHWTFQADLSLRIQAP